jgi:hypothetical protein
MANSVYDYSSTSALANGTTAGDAVSENATAPSAVNNAIRGHKYYHKLWLDDQAGVNQTVGGTANAITLTTSQGFTAYGTADGQIKNGTEIAFKNTVGPNTAATTINVNAIGIKKIRGQGDVDLAGGEMVDDGIFRLRYDTAADAAAGAWILLNPASSSVADASTTAKGIIEIATRAETNAQTDTARAVVPANLFYPTGHLYGLALTTAADAANDITMAVGTARDATDTYNMNLASSLTKQLDVAWALGTNAGGLDTGAVGNNRYAIWLIGRSDTGVIDWLYSLSFTAPTMPANYDFKLLVGEVTRTAATNGAPIWYGRRSNATTYDLPGPHVILEDQKSSGTAGGAFTSGADRTRTLNTEVYDAFGICSLSSDQFTLPAGTYYIAWSAPGHVCGVHQTFLYNETDTAEVKRGSSEASSTSTATSIRSFGSTVVTIAGSKAFTLKHRCGTTRNTDGLGPAASFGTEVYARVEITKVA